MHRMSGGEIAGLIAAVAFVFLVGLVTIPLLKLGKVLDETRGLVRGVSDGTIPLLQEATTTVTATNAQLAKVDAITTHASTASGNVSALTGLFAATLGTPVVKVAAFSYGVRRALAGGAATSHGQRDRQVHRQLRAEGSAQRGLSGRGA